MIHGFQTDVFHLVLQNILLDSVNGGMIYLNRLMLGTFLVVFVPLSLLEIMWSINTEEPIEIK